MTTIDSNEFVTIEEDYRERQAADPSLPPLTPDIVKLIEERLRERGAEQGPPRIITIDCCGQPVASDHESGPSE